MRREGVVVREAEGRGGGKRGGRKGGGGGREEEGRGGWGVRRGRGRGGILASMARNAS